MCKAQACYLICFWFLSPEPDTTQWFLLSLHSWPLKDESLRGYCNYNGQNQNKSIPSARGQKPWERRAGRTGGEQGTQAHTAVNMQQVLFASYFCFMGVNTVLTLSSTWLSYSHLQQNWFIQFEVIAFEKSEDFLFKNVRDGGKMYLKHLEKFKHAQTCNYTTAEAASSSPSNIRLQKWNHFFRETWHCWVQQIFTGF